MYKKEVGNIMKRSLDEIIDAAVVNTLSRLRNEEPRQKVVKRTGNKKALHQKERNKPNIWANR